MGDRAGARPYYERALAIREAALGPDHPDTARSLNNLAILCYHEGDMPEAARLMRRALEIREARLGPEHPDTQGSRQSLTIIEARLGDDDG
jgi:Tfp pilus assembly protein PilF